jgi:4-hydroxybenzoate polyprenyltransferase
MAETLIWAGALALAIIAYDFIVKTTWLGPINMGLCRTLNLCLAMSTAPGPGGVGLMRPSEWAVAVLIGVYVAGITLVARREAGGAHRAMLAGGALVMLLALALLAAVVGISQAEPFGAANAAVRRTGLLALGLVGLLVLVRAARATGQPTANRIQAAVQSALFSLPLLDAILCYIASGGRLYPPTALLALALVGVVLGKRIRAT